jgi:hypothetical protein
MSCIGTESIGSSPGGVFKMTAIKLTAIVFSAGVLFELFSPSDFGPDLVLAIISCFS